MKRKKPYKIIENIKVGEIASEGKCVSRHEDKVIFIEHVAPGDVVDVKILKNKKSYANAVPVNFHSYSDLRETPFCEHFGTCGGCKLQHVNYQAQLSFKTRQVKDNLERIGKLDLPEINPIIPSVKTTHYRNKLEYTFSNKRWFSLEEMHQENSDADALGFHVPGRFDKIIDVKNCYLQPEPSNAIRLEVKKYAKDKKLDFFDMRNQAGLLRNLIIRNTSTNELMVIVQFFRNDEKEISGLMSHLKNIFPQITSLYYVVNSKGNETFHDQELILFSGKPFIQEQMEDLVFQIGPKSFYQTNSQQAYELYKVAREYAGLKGDEVVYDLYTGTGTIANFVAKKCKKVIGVEFVPMAIEDAKKNSEVNNISNTFFVAGDMKDILIEEFIQLHGQPDVIITDPPRAGMHEDVVQMLRKIAAAKIVYVSCNSATQARDLALLSDMYEVKKVQPVDMFPQTPHVENVVLLEKKNI
ncbi:MAG: 23S rRNA (uracil(1939)-C(5))-methyltransferase RlmD [Cytophagaceae bacterium]|nr:23S rRNA (uracil(1939)-C(5))-methyltransferase RlmD [Cytophagaceae bacterium]